MRFQVNMTWNNMSYFHIIIIIIILDRGVTDYIFVMTCHEKNWSFFFFSFQFVDKFLLPPFKHDVHIFSKFNKNSKMHLLTFYDFLIYIKHVHCLRNCKFLFFLIWLCINLFIYFYDVVKMVINYKKIFTFGLGQVV
jgi:hypothetical protein